MIANDISPKNGKRRLNRIRTASRVFRILIGLTVIGTICFWCAFYFGWPNLIHDDVRIVVSQNHVYTKPAQMPAGVLALALIRTGLAFFCLLILNNLFRLYEQGIFFSAKNVNYIRFLGYYLMIDWGVNFELQSLGHDVALSTNQILAGLMIIFFAWIMDEGRKIQEEQALTV